MRIAQISPLNSRVPPTAYGGTELIVSLLTEALIRRGHTVTLFASADSVTRAELVPACEHFLKNSGRTPTEKLTLEMINVINCLRRAREFDIIHNHSFPAGLAMAALSAAPALTTIHENLEGPRESLFVKYGGWHNTVSKSAKGHLPEKERFIGTIYNAIDCDSYPFNEGDRKGHLLFLAALIPQKGPHLAIEVAQRLQRRLIIAGTLDETYPEYFRNEIKPRIDGKLIQFFGEADSEQKRELLSQADCLLAPWTWEEPFGLQLIEAMACGTPAIAFNRGAAPEVISHGKTGFVVSTIDEMVVAVKNVPFFDRGFCRRYVKERFNVKRMVDDYLGAYEYILERS